VIGMYRDALRLEIQRLLSVRSTYVLVSLAVTTAVLLDLFIAVFSPVGTLSHDDTAAALTVGADLSPLSVVGLWVGVLAVTAVSHDYRYRLVRAVLTAVPRRGVLLAARLTVLGVVAAACASLVPLLSAAGCLALGRRPVLDTTTAHVVAAHLVVVVGWAWLGAGVGWLVRHAAGAIAVLLVVPLIVEPLLLLAIRWGPGKALLRPVVPVLPFSAAREALGQQLDPGRGSIGALLSAVVFGVEVVVVILLTWAVVRRRDA